MRDPDRHQQLWHRRDHTDGEGVLQGVPEELRGQQVLVVVQAHPGLVVQAGQLHVVQRVPGRVQQRHEPEGPEDDEEGGDERVRRRLHVPAVQPAAPGTRARGRRRTATVSAAGRARLVTGRGVGARRGLRESLLGAGHWPSTSLISALAALQPWSGVLPFCSTWRMPTSVMAVPIGWSLTPKFWTGMVFAESAKIWVIGAFEK